MDPFRVPKLYPNINLTSFEKIKDILCQPIKDELSKINNVIITSEDCRSLAGKNWVNDNIVNVFQSMMNEKFAEFYYGLDTFSYVNIERFEGKYTVPKVDITQLPIVSIPIHLIDHWVGVTYSTSEKQLICYDSLSDEFREDVVELVLLFLKHTFNHDDIEIVNGLQFELPKQQNLCDCGILMMAFFEGVCLPEFPHFDDGHAEYFRMKFILEVVSGGKMLT